MQRKITIVTAGLMLVLSGFNLGLALLQLFEPTVPHKIKLKVKIK
ncbi:hypothetical protein [Lactobacillus sp. CBA3605]|nr:hypothetical protein [Lactobacillus sp. CBA3605]